MEGFNAQQQIRLAERLYTGLRLGQELDSMEVVFTEEDVRAFAAAIGDENPWYLEASPFGQPVCHPAITADLAIRLFQQSSSKILGDNAPPRAGIHAKAERRYTNPLPVGKRLTLQGKVVEKYIRRDRYYVVVEVWVVDEDGRNIVRIEDTLLLSPVRISEKVD